MSWHDGLTEKQRRFCEAYAANGGSARSAAISAGYKNPDVLGSQNLDKLSIRKALEALRAEETSKAIATREERQSFWTAVLRSPAELMKDRLKASELLGRSQADFLDRHELTAKDGAPLIPARTKSQIEQELIAAGFDPLKIALEE